IGPLMSFGQASETGELALVPRSGDDKAATRDDAWVRGLPKLQPAQTKRLDDGLRRLRLAIGRQHGAGNAAGHTGSFLRLRLVQGDGMAAARQFEGLPQPEDAAA